MSDWIKHKRMNWPNGSRAKFLEEDGSKSLFESVQKRMNQKHAMPSETHEDYIGMKKIIDELTLLLKGFDLDSMDQMKRKELARMPLNSLRDALKWKRAWGEVLGIKDNGEDGRE